MPQEDEDVVLNNKRKKSRQKNPGSNEKKKGSTDPAVSQGADQGYPGIEEGSGPPQNSGAVKKSKSSEEMEKLATGEGPSMQETDQSTPQIQEILDTSPAEPIGQIEDQPGTSVPTESIQSPSEIESLSTQPLPIFGRKGKGTPSVRPSLDTTSSVGTIQDDIPQQTLPVVWQPSLTCRSLARNLLILGFFTLGLSVCSFFITYYTPEYRFPYNSSCSPVVTSESLSSKMSSIFGMIHKKSSSVCSIPITIPSDMQTPVFFYYEISNLFQNHRSVVRSMDYSQLHGDYLKDDMTPIAPNSDCGHLSTSPSGKVYLPCGALPNLYFTDQFTLQNSKAEEIKLRSESISWPSLKSFRFKNNKLVTPATFQLMPLLYINFTKPRDWSTSSWIQWWSEGGMENERFINWMTPSAQSTFRKLYGIIDTVPGCTHGVLCKGTYSLLVNLNSPLERFPGTEKAVIIGSTSILGAPNYRIPILLGVVAILEVLTALLLLQVEYIVKKSQKRNFPAFILEKRQDKEGVDVLFFHPIQETKSKVVFPDDWVDMKHRMKTNYNFNY